jgi:hypothetical protein
MKDALDLWDRRGHDMLTLDDAAMSVAGFGAELRSAPAPDVVPAVPAQTGDHAELHSAVLAFQQANPAADYATALEAVVGESFDLGA